MTSKLTHPSLGRNALYLYGVQFCRKLLPFVCLPRLARVLGPAGWGRVAFSLAFGEILIVLIEFGFNLSATRELARRRESKEECRRIASGVLGSQVLLCVAAIVCALIARAFVPGLSDYPRLFAAGLFYGIAQGTAPLWFFQGLEMMSTGAILEIAGKLLSVCLVFVVAHDPTDDWKVVLVQAFPSCVSTIAGIVLIGRIVGFSRPQASDIRRAIRTGWPLFLFRSGLSLYGLANAFILGLFAPAAQIGYYASAEKISKAAAGLLAPLKDALYPRLSHLARHSPSEGRMLARTGSLIAVATGALVSLSLFLLAPFAIRILMGRGFESSIAVLRILAILPVVIAVTDSLGLQWLLPQGRDITVTRVIYAGGLLNIALSFLLATRFGHLGMALAVVTAESFVAALLFRAARRTSASDPVPMPVATEQVCAA